jgi:hypothetical protein
MKLITATNQAQSTVIHTEVVTVRMDRAGTCGLGGPQQGKVWDYNMILPILIHLSSLARYIMH